MKPIYAHLGGALALSFTLAACIPSPDSTPAPDPVQTTPAPAPAPTPTPAPVMHDNWMDAAKSPGNWSYRNDANGSVALFGEPQTDARFSMRCDRSASSITLMRAADASGPIQMRISTETADRTFNAQPTRGQLPYVSASLSARDPILDAMALTKGRFAVEMQGVQTLYLPAWAEVTRVIEDCR